MSLKRFIGAIAAVAVGAVALTFSMTRSGDTVAALEFVVDTTVASDDVNPGDGLCADSGGACSLRAAIMEVEAIGGDNQIVLPSDTYDLGGPISVASKLTIIRDWGVAAMDDPNPVIDLADGPGFRVALGWLRFNGVDIVNGLDVDGIGGAAVHAVGAEVGLYDGEFRNHRSDGYGGAVFVSNGTFSTAGARFVDNSALGGGAVSVIGSAVTSLGSVFETNGSSGSGGAIHLVQPRSLNIDGTTFTDNIALDQGGAMYLRGQSSRGWRQVFRSTFESNSAGNEGGAVFVGPGTDDVDVRFWNNTFRSNVALVGGGVATDLARVKIENSTFEENRSVGGAGGAIGAGGPLVVTGSDFDANEADGNGGAIGSNAGLDITDSDFTGNRATGFGGAIATFSESTPQIAGGSMTENVGDEGAGALWRVGSDPDLQGVDVSDNVPADEQLVVNDPTPDDDTTTTAPPTTAPPTTAPPTTAPPTTAPPTTVPPTTPGPQVVSLVPARLFETRAAVTVDGRSQGVGRVGVDGVAEVVVSGRGGVPAGAGAVMLNVTAVGPSASGYLTVFPCGSSRPEASTLNFGAGAVVANGALAKVGSGGKVCVYSSAATDLLVDVTGYVR